MLRLIEDKDQNILLLVLGDSRSSSSSGSGRGVVLSESFPRELRANCLLRFSVSTLGPLMRLTNKLRLVRKVGIEGNGTDIL